jgi:hypothetical protein
LSGGGVCGRGAYVVFLGENGEDHLVRTKDRRSKELEGRVQLPLLRELDIVLDALVGLFVTINIMISNK